MEQLKNNNTYTFPDIIKQLIKTHETFLKYSIIGCMGVTIDFIVFTILTQYFSMFYQYANAISVSCGITNNFFFNAFFNFKKNDKLFMRFISFYTVGLIGLGISAAMLYIFIDILNVNEIISKVIIIFIVTIVQFFCNKLITFRTFNK